MYKTAKKAQALSKGPRWYTQKQIHEAWVRTLTGTYGDTLIYNLYDLADKPFIKIEEINPHTAVFREGKPILLGRGPDGNGDLLSLIYVDDLVQVIKVSVYEGWNGLFDVAASEVLSVRHIANEIGRQLGILAVFEEVDFPAKKMSADLTILNEKSRTGLRNFSEVLSALLEQERL